MMEPAVATATRSEAAESVQESAVDYRMPAYLRNANMNNF